MIIYWPSNQTISPFSKTAEVVPFGSTQVECAHEMSWNSNAYVHYTLCRGAEGKSSENVYRNWIELEFSEIDYRAQVAAYSSQSNDQRTVHNGCKKGKWVSDQGSSF